MALASGTRDDANNTDPRGITIVRATKFTLISNYSSRWETSKPILEHDHPARATVQPAYPAGSVGPLDAVALVPQEAHQAALARQVQRADGDRLLRIGNSKSDRKVLRNAGKINRLLAL